MNGGLGFEKGTEGSGGGKVFFSNSGTEANEGALKIARKVGKDRSPSGSKTRLVCFEGSFHGRSMGALSVTSNPKYQKPFAPLIPGVDVGRLNEMRSVEELIGPDTCGVIVEPIQGEGGVHVAEVDWLRAVRKRCHEVGAVLIFDEIQCGLFRTSTMWAHSEYPADCHPDMVTMAKPLGNGYPIGAVLLRNDIADTMSVGSHGTTFGGSPLASAVAFHVLERLSSMQPSIVDASSYLAGRLARLPGWFPDILQENIRGRGLIRGLGFKNGENASKIVTLARDRGVLVLTAGTDAVRLVPSLTIGHQDVDAAVDVLESCIGLLGHN